LEADFPVDRGVPARVCAGLGLYALAGGLVSFLGWALDVPRLTDWFNDGVSIQPNTCVALMSAGSALCLAALGRRRAAVPLAILAALIGVATLSEYVARVDLGIDDLLTFGRPWGHQTTVTTGRMGPPASTSFTLIGTALVLLTLSGTAAHRARRAVLALGVGVAAISLFSLLGYLFVAQAFYTIPWLTAIALQTSTMFMALAVGVICMVPEQGILSLLRDPGPAGILVRRVMPVVILAPVVIGFLRLTGERAGLYDSATGVTLRTLAEIFLFLALTWWTGSGIAKEVRRSDLVRASLRESQARLEAELGHTRLLAEASAELMVEDDEQSLYERIVDAAVTVTHSHSASLQMLDAQRGGLRLLAGRGLNERAVSRWAWVSVDHPTSCAETLRTGRRSVITDVSTHEPLAGSEDLATFLDTGIRSMQTTPLLSRGGRLLGMITTHWSQPHSPSDRDLHLLDILARQAADVIERKQARETLQLSEERSRSMVSVMTDVVWSADADGAFVTPQGSWQAYTGQSWEQCRGYGWADALHEEDRQHCLENWRQACRLGKLYESRGRLWHARSGAYRHFQLRATPLFHPDGRIREWVGSCTDVHEQRQAVEALHEADRRKDEFLATLAHELRNPLAPVRNAAHILRRAAPAVPELVWATDAINRQVHHMTRLIDDLMDVSRISRGKLQLRVERVALSDVVQSAVETTRPLIDRLRHTLAVNLPPRPVHLDADPTRLAQVLGNLLHNAAKFTPPGGHISLAAEAAEGDIRIVVTDSGIGLTQEMQTRVFDMFTQGDRSLERSGGGLGIGLTLVKQLVEMHGGSVEVASDGAGKGSRFTIRLPSTLQVTSSPLAEEGERA
jgi:PAS domain S-box-containing protein